MLIFSFFLFLHLWLDQAKRKLSLYLLQSKKVSENYLASMCVCLLRVIPPIQFWSHWLWVLPTTISSCSKQISETNDDFFSGCVDQALQFFWLSFQISFAFLILILLLQKPSARLCKHSHRHSQSVTEANRIEELQQLLQMKSEVWCGLFLLFHSFLCLSSINNNGAIYGG